MYIFKVYLVAEILNDHVVKLNIVSNPSKEDNVIASTSDKNLNWYWYYDACLKTDQEREDFLNEYLPEYKWKT